MAREHKAKEQDRIPQEEITEVWDEEDLGLDWDESEFQRIAGQLRTERGATPL